MKFPKFLKNNGTIGITAPSFGMFIEPYPTRGKNAIKAFENKGYKIKASPNATSDDDHLESSSKLERAKQLQELYLDNEVDVIMSCGGGERMMEILNYLDFDKIKSAVPKWYMGYSDNTNFTFFLTTLADVASLYGPCFPDFGRDKWYEEQINTYNLLIGKELTQHSYEKYELVKDEEHPFTNINATEPVKIEHLTKEKKIIMEGRLLGGCLDCLVTACGTKFDKVKEFNKKYAKDGVIWFLEACDMIPTQTLRAIWQLKNAGWFDNAKGFIIGRSRLPDSFGYLTHQKAIYETLSDLNVPIIYGADIGHLPPMMTMITGAYATITSQDNKLEVKQELK